MREASNPARIWGIVPLSVCLKWSVRKCLGASWVSEQPVVGPFRCVYPHTTNSYRTISNSICRRLSWVLYSYTATSTAHLASSKIAVACGVDGCPRTSLFQGLLEGNQPKGINRGVRVQVWFVTLTLKVKNAIASELSQATKAKLIDRRCSIQHRLDGLENINNYTLHSFTFCTLSLSLSTY